MSDAEEYRRLQAEAEAKQREIKELEAILVALERELVSFQAELERRRQIVPPKPEVIYRAPVSLPAPKITLGEAIISPEWWRENWPWMGVGLVGLVLIIISAKS